ncbi:glycosyltransferase family 4 protein [Magnetospirillum molischianum]|uniref:Putative glycosyltransferase n=1 Tax=Magnetospirillum molischianum DSM 120 TaxID=1150626 RepID=H8FUT7_MAGML|nr:glycosyltransferase family 1 protein [Magnetospirillum molischianum]CCG42125.1 putative glycosyltransferase [Magnetospirillum molischianum DSM 120]
MKITLSVDALSPSLTGIGRYTWELTRRLPSTAGIGEVRYYRNGRWIADPATLLTDSVPRRRSRLVLPKPAWVRRWALRRACRGLLFHGTNYFLPDCTDIGVITVHDLSVFKFPETHPVERIRQFEANFNRSVRKAAHVITDSEATRGEVIDFLACSPSFVTAVPLGVESRFAPQTQRELDPLLRSFGLAYRRYSLCVSTLEPRKRIGHLIEAYRQLPEALRRSVPLVLVGGGGWCNDGLKLEIQRGQSEGWLLSLGFLPDTQLPGLYAGASLFVYPSLYEGFGLPVLEAMASGVPVVTSDRTSLPEVTGGAAALIDPDDVMGLKEAIHRGLEDEAWRHHASTVGLATARHFDWNRCAENTVVVYRKVLSGSNAV